MDSTEYFSWSSTEIPLKLRRNRLQEFSRKYPLELHRKFFGITTEVPPETPTSPTGRMPLEVPLRVSQEVSKTSPSGVPSRTPIRVLPGISQ